MDAFKVAQNIEMKGTRLYAFGTAFTQPGQMAFCVSKLGDPQLGLFFDQRASNSHVLINKKTKGKLQVFNNALVKHCEFSRAVLRELVLVLDLLAGQLHQILVDDVSDMLEIDGEGDYLHGASPIPIVKAFAGYFGDVEFYRLVQSIDDVVHARDFGRELAVVAHQCRHRLSQHALDDITHVQCLARGAG